MDQKMTDLLEALQPFLKVAYRNKEDFQGKFNERATEVVVHSTAEEIEAARELIEASHPELPKEAISFGNMKEVLAMDSIHGNDWVELLRAANEIQPYKDPIEEQINQNNKG